MSKLEGFIERFEDDQAVIVKVDHSVESVERSLLPYYAQEGDFLVPTDDEKAYRIDYEVTEQRRREIRRLMDCLFD